MSQAGIASLSESPLPPSVPESFVTDSGTAVPAANILNIKSLTNNGSTVQFTGSGNTVQLKVTDSTNSTLIGKGAGKSGSTGTANTGVGFNAISVVTSGSSNSSIGYGSLASLTTGSFNSSIGTLCLAALTTGTQNSSYGDQTLASLVTGSYNLVLGVEAGSAYTGGESSNILISNSGVLGESNVIRIGSQGSGNGQQNQCYVAGINGVTTANSQIVTINSATGQMGIVATPSGGQLLRAGAGSTLGFTTATYPASAGTSGNVLTSDGTNWTSAAPASGGITTINGDSGSATGSTISLLAYNASNNAGGSVKFVASGATVLLDVTDSNQNTFFGSLAGGNAVSGSGSCGFGREALVNLTNGSSNNAFGNNTMQLSSNAANNQAFGNFSLSSLRHGTYNIGIGDSAGLNYTGTESHNILLNSEGVTGESNTLRLGAATGTGQQQLNQSFICGINGISVTGTAVLVSASDQLGILVSSAKYKDNIVDMVDSSKIYDLRPVEFTYKNDEIKYKHYGLIAEEVETVLPALVQYNKDKQPMTVSYHELPALLLNEIIKLRKEINDLKAKIL